MIKFTRDKTKVTVNLSTNRGFTVPFSYTQNDELDAILLHEHLEKQMRDYMEAERRTAYEDGYKHGKNHQKKTQFFSRQI